MRLLLVLLVGAGSSQAVDNGVGSVPIMGFDAWYAFSPYSSGPCGGTYHNAPNGAAVAFCRHSLSSATARATAQDQNAGSA